MQFLWLFILLSLLAEIIGTVGGFGSSVFFVPVANFFFDFQSVLGITALFHVSSNLTKIGMFRKGIDWRLVLMIGVPAIVLGLAGAYATSYFESKSLQIYLASFLILISVIFLTFKKLEIKANPFNALIGGASSGFLAGFLGSGGPLRGLTLVAYNLRKEIFVATSAFIDLGIDLGRSAIYFSNGYIHQHDLYYLPFLVLVAIVGTWIGKKTLEKIPQNKFRNLVLILVLIIGIVTLIQGLI